MTDELVGKIIKGQKLEAGLIGDEEFQILSKVQNSRGGNAYVVNVDEITTSLYTQSVEEIKELEGGIPIVGADGTITWVTFIETIENQLTFDSVINYDVNTGTLSHVTTDGNRHIPVGGTSGQALVTDGNGIYSWETFILGSSPAAGITAQQIINWDIAFGWGDHAGLYDLLGTASGLVTAHESTYVHADIALNTTHRTSNGSDHTYIDQSVVSGSAPNLVNTNMSGDVSVWTNDAGYLTSFVETDPVFVASAASGISAGDITNWDTAYTHSQITTGNPHSLDYSDVGAEQAFSKNTAFNKNFDGVGSSTTVSRSDHYHGFAHVGGAFTLSTGWTFLNAFSECRIVDPRTAHIKFRLSKDGAGNHATIGTLSASYRPASAQQAMFRLVNSNIGGYIETEIVINTDGTVVQIQALTTAAFEAYLDVHYQLTP